MRRGAVVGLLVVLLFGAQPAWAEPPLDVGTRITDQVGALVGDTVTVQDAVERLEAERGIRLFVVLVSSFDADSPDAWIEETAAASELEGSDLLLAVAAAEGTYQYQWWVSDTFPGASAHVERILITDVEPRFAAGDWSGGVVALADGLGGEAAAQVPDGELQAAVAWTTTTTVLVLAALAAVFLLAHLLSRRAIGTRSSR